MKYATHVNITFFVADDIAEKGVALTPGALDQCREWPANWKTKNFLMLTIEKIKWDIGCVEIVPMSLKYKWIGSIT